jgi:protein tyrosine phosphatase (PTP) superfamily phosphohydrolase (DUF442 family)
MRNARKYNDRVTIGGVPDSEDLAQLKELGYKTLIDLREEAEKFGGLVKKRASEMGFRYTEISITRSGIRMEDVVRFYQAIYEKGSAPIYAFSRFGRKPLAFLLLFDGVANRERNLVHKIIRRSAEFGINLEGDLVLQEFLIDILSSGDVEPVVESIRKLRPDLLGN